MSIENKVFYFTICSHFDKYNMYNICNVFTMLHIYNEQDSVSWLYIELLNNVLLFPKLRNIFGRYSQKFGRVDFYFVKFKKRSMKLEKRSTDTNIIDI